MSNLVLKHKIKKDESKQGIWQNDENDVAWGRWWRVEKDKKLLWNGAHEKLGFEWEKSLV